MRTPNKPRSLSRRILELVLFAMLGATMFATRTAMAVLPNIHPLAMFIMVCTIVFRVRALIPLYLYVMLEGLFWGFSPWWYPYLYIWTILWGLTMLLPKGMSKKAKCVVYPVVCAFHGIMFGVLYAPAEAILYKMSWEKTLLWIVRGIPFDLLHCFGDFCMGLLVFPLSELLIKLLKRLGD